MIDAKKRNDRLAALTKIAILSALAFVLMLFEFPILVIAPGFYKLDFSEIPVLLGGFSLGPVAALVIELIKNLLNLILHGTVTGGVGEFANFIVGVAFTVPAAIIYKSNKTKSGALLSMLVGTLSFAFFGWFMNYFVLIPVYAKAFFGGDISKVITFKDSQYSLATFVTVCVVPFNLIKGVISSVLTFFLYKRVSGLLHK